MTDIFLETDCDPPTSPPDVMASIEDAQSCLDLHRVEWKLTLLSTDGTRMICWFRAPDMESARIAARETQAEIQVFWLGAVHDGAGVGETDVVRANVLVERSFAEGVELQEIQDIEEAGAWCLEARDVRFVRTFFSRDQRRMICLYEAPDAESVRLAQRQAGVPFDDAWAFVRLAPDVVLDTIG